MPYSKRNNGFTTVEVMVIAPIVILVLAVFVVAIVTMVGDVLASRKQNTIAYDIQDALNRINQDVKVSGGYLATNNIALTSPQGINNDTTSFDNSNSATYGTPLILNSYATTGNPFGSATTRDVVYLSNSPNLCSSAQVIQNRVMMTNIVYFSKNNSLWRRVIMPSNYLTAGCSTPWQKPSCAPDYTAAFCKAEDQKLVDGVGVTDFHVSYYPNPSSTNENNNATDPTATDSFRQETLRTTNTIIVDITAHVTAAGSNLTQTGSIKAVSPNNNS
jgi:type II secretory pathway pseudopilin PulG